MKKAPLIGITVDNVDRTAASGMYRSGIHYSRAVVAAGGIPLLLPHEPALADRYAALCDALMLTGGADPRMEGFGCMTDGRANVMDEQRQAFELALLAAVDRENENALPGTPHKPVLGICLGMQLMALHNGGMLDQFLPDSLGEQASLHQNDSSHPLVIAEDGSALGLPAGETRVRVTSSHRQAVCDAGQLRVIARAADGTLEAIDAPGRAFYLGVQWHPERTAPGTPHPLGWDLIARLVDAAKMQLG